MKLFESKKAENESSPLTLTGIGLMIALITLSFILITGCKFSESLKTSPDKFTNDDLPVLLVSDLTNLQKHSSADKVPMEKINGLPDARDINVYSSAYFKSRKFELGRGEVLLFFSDLSEKISLDYVEGKEVKSSIEFTRPASCGLGACICYYDLIKLWGFNKDLTEVSTYNNPSSLLIKNCENVGSNIIFTNGRKYYEDADIDFFKSLSVDDRLPLPLEFSTMANYYSNLNIEKNYLLTNNFVDSPQPENLLKFALQKQRWSGGVVMGDFGHSPSGSLQTNYGSGEIELFLVDFLLTKPYRVISVNINTPFGFKNTQLDKLYYELAFNNMLNTLAVFEATDEEKSLVFKKILSTKQGIIQNNLIILNEVVAPIESALNMAIPADKNPTITIIPVNENNIKTIIKVELDDFSKEIKSDVEFKLHENLGSSYSFNTYTQTEEDYALFLSNSIDRPFSLIYEEDGFVFEPRNKVPTCVDLELSYLTEHNDVCLVKVVGVLNDSLSFSRTTTGYDPAKTLQNPADIEIHTKLEQFIMSNLWTFTDMLGNNLFSDMSYVSYKEIKPNYDCSVPKIISCNSQFKD